MPNESGMGVTLRYNRRYNLGAYQHEDITIEITGPYEELVNGTSKISALLTVTSALGTLTNSVYLQNRNVDKEVFKPQ